MAVYREGYHCLERIQNQTVQVFNDAIDHGVPVKKCDKIWGAIKQLKEWYGIEGTRKQETDDSISFDFELMDEWAVTDGRKTEAEATERYKLTYTKLENYKSKPYLNSPFRGADGFVFIYKL